MSDTFEISRMRSAIEGVVARGEVNLDEMANASPPLSPEVVRILDDQLAHGMGGAANTPLDERLRSQLQGVFKERLAAKAAIQHKYEEFSGFGQPTTPFALGAEGRGYYRHFELGSVFWLPASGAHLVHGAIRDKYASLGWEGSYLGYPLTDELSRQTQDGEVRYNDFENGAIRWTSSGRAHTDLMDVTVERHQLEAWLHMVGTGSWIKRRECP